SLDQNDYRLFYHSGATEGINTLFKGISHKYFNEKKAASFFFSTVDHACALQLKEELESFGHHVFFFDVDHNGLFNTEALIKKINQEKSIGHDCFMNFTYINNESGIVWPLSQAIKIKEETNSFIHVDAVQLVGKIFDWNYLSSKLDAYTFSGHKFGAMKGVGLSFVKKETKFSPLLVGGNQQFGLRAGTENALGIYSLKLALEDINEHFKADELLQAKNYIESKLIDLIGAKGQVVGLYSPHRNINTIFFVLHGQKAEILSAKFDLQGIDLSTGSACSSGIIKENRILMSMGFGSEDSRSSLRLSFSPLMTKSEAVKYFDKIENVISSILKL
ncbi:MAG: aminotransferase class V-fold PLP-dependent enzyme, partial [Alphaproteobacteria bacterium]